MVRNSRIDGPLGKYDKGQLQRGLKVYAEVCAACHSLNLVSFRNFADLGYNEDEVKAIAKGWKTEVPSINPETGEPATRPGIPADKIPSPFANEVAARAANNNALPPDLSLITKARARWPGLCLFAADRLSRSRLQAEEGGTA